MAPFGTRSVETNRDPKGQLRGRCTQVGCSCYQYSRRQGSNACDRCSHPSSKHTALEDRPSCTHTDDGGVRCGCTEWEKSAEPIGDKECYNCNHPKEKHGIGGTTADGIDVTQPAVGGNAWSVCAELAKSIRAGDSEKANAKKRSSTSWGGSRENAGRKKKCDGARPEQRMVKVLPVKITGIGFGKAGRADDILMDLPLSMASIGDAARKVFSERYGTNLEARNEIFMVSTDGSSLKDMHLPTVKRVFYYNPYFATLPTGRAAIEREFGLQQQLNVSDDSDAEDDRKKHEDKQSTGVESISVVPKFGDGSSTRRCESTDSGRDIQPDLNATIPAYSDPDRHPYADGYIGGAYTPYLAVVEPRPSDGVTSTPIRNTILSNFDSSTTGEYGAGSSHFRDELASTTEADENRQLLIAVGRVSGSLFDIITAMTGSMEAASIWIEKNMTDGLFNTTKDLLRVFDQFRGRNEKTKVISVKRLGMPPQVIEKQLLAVFKQAKKDELGRDANVMFDEEEGVGDGLINPYVGLLQKHILEKHFEGNIDHKIPRKVVENESLSRMVGHVIGHVMCQSRPVMIGISSVFKNFIAGIAPSEIQVTAKDVPFGELVPVLEKLLEKDGSVEKLNDEEKSVLSSSLVNEDLMENVRTLASMRLPEQGQELVVANALMKHLVFSSRLAQYEELQNGILEICDIRVFIKAGEREDGLNPCLAIMDFFFPSYESSVIKRDEMRGWFEVFVMSDLPNRDSLKKKAEDFLDDVINALPEGKPGGNEATLADLWEYLTGAPYRFKDELVQVWVTDRVKPPRVIMHVCSLSMEIHPDKLNDDAYMNEMKKMFTEILKVDGGSFGSL